MTFIEFLKRFPNERAVIDQFIKIKFGDTPYCHICSSSDVYHRQDTPKRFQCRNCKNSFSLFTNTIFEGTSIDLVKWMYAIHLMLNSKKGISGLQLQREIGGQYKNSWRILNKIRQAMSNIEDDHWDHFQSIVEVDETYVGGKPRKTGKGASILKSKRGRGTTKIPVVGVMDREKKKVFAVVALPNDDGKQLSGKQLLTIINFVVRKDVVIITDEFRSYNVLRDTNHIHLRIDHTKEYCNGEIHTNTIESFWATLKRGVYGIYHHISVKYLQQYVNEFCFRYNNRTNPNIFDLLLEKCVLGY